MIRTQSVHLSKRRSKLLGIGGGAIAFASLGLGALILAWVLFPFSALTIKDLKERQRWNRLCIHYAFKYYLKLLSLLGAVRLEVESLGDNNSAKANFLIANHPCLLDVVAIMGTRKDLQCVVKKELWNHFFMKGVVKGAGFLSNELGPEDFLEACRRSLHEGTSILIFPEGTRTVPYELPHFPRSFGNLAIALEADIQTLLITCTPNFLSKESKWYSILPVTPELSICKGRLFPINSFDPSLPRPRRVRQFVSQIQSYYSDALGEFYG